MALRGSQAKVMSLSKGLLQPWLPSSTAIRWRTRKPNIQRPGPPHWEKAKYLAVVKPYYEPEQKPVLRVCHNVLKASEGKVKEENMYVKLLAKDLRQKFEESLFVGIYHRNSTTAEDKMKIRAMLHPHDMKMFNPDFEVMSLALVGTPYEPVLKLLHKQTSVLFSKNPAVGKLLKLDKKMPTYILIGGFLEGRLLNKDQLTWYSKLPSIDMLRAELCGILSSAASGVSQSLMYHQQTLSQSLGEYERMQSTPAQNESPDNS